MTLYLLDTNVLIRFTIRDDPAQAARADGLFGRAAAGECLLLLGDAVLIETIWVLRSVYDQPRERIAQKLAELITKKGVQCDSPPVMLDALQRYGQTKLDIVDCLLAARAVLASATVATFDEDIGKKFADVQLWDRSGDT